MNFKCFICKETKPVPASGGTGYGRDENERKICYSCCGDRDRAELIKMELGDKTCLYLYFDNDNAWHSGLSQNWNNSGAYVSNWPGTLKISVGAVKRGRHNIAGKRYDFWFRFHGSKFHGVQYGDNTQAAHIQRVRS